MQKDSVIQFRKHQEAFVKKNPNRSLNWWDCRTGKTLAAAHWAKNQSRNSNILVICPKKIKSTWLKALPEATTYTKEEIKKVQTPVGLSAIIIDECHRVASELYTNKRSAVAECVYNIVYANQNADILLLSGTPVTNNPASLHTLMVYLQIAPEWSVYRNYMYDLVTNHFMLKKYKKRVKMWQPKKDWKKRAYAILEKKIKEGYIDRVRLQDCVDEMPPETVEVVNVKGNKHECDDCHWTHHHLAEQENKHTWLEDNRFRKALVVAHYREQVVSVANQISKFSDVYMVHGGVKNQDEVIKQWQEAPDGYLVISATMGEGFDAYMADCIIFLSLSHKVIDHTQMKERLTTLDKDNIKPKLYYYLIGGKWDKKIYESVVTAGKDFHYT